MPAQRLKVLIVDDHLMVREGVCAMLNSQYDKCVFRITEADSGEDGIQKVKRNNYDIVLLDYQLPGLNGPETLSRMLLIRPELRVLVLSYHNDYSYITKMMETGAKGYTLKNIGPNELLSAIQTILNGKEYYANDVSLKLMQVRSQNGIRIKNLKLTNRDLEVLKCIASEMSNEETSSHLQIAKRTVDFHRNKLIKKLSVKNSAGLVKLAVELKLV